MSIKVNSKGYPQIGSAINFPALGSNESKLSKAVNFSSIILLCYVFCFFFLIISFYVGPNVKKDSKKT